MEEMVVVDGMMMGRSLCLGKEIELGPLPLRHYVKQDFRAMTLAATFAPN